MNTHETIVAISSSVSPAGRMIVRLSGDRALERVNDRLAGQKLDDAGAFRVELYPPPGLDLLGGGGRIRAWAYVFRAPKSYTGDDSVELHLPGNPLLARCVVEDLIARGARSAEPGEFTSRAYLNGRIDLTAAEGVAMTIAAGNEAELKAARQLMAGELSRRVMPMLEQLADTLALLEAGIDFVEEDISFIASADLRQRVEGIAGDIVRLLEETTRIERMTHEPRFALVGRPNAGKSTLLNALARSDRAVVSPTAGTTRDALSVRVMLKQGAVTVVDVAGLEQVEDDPHGIHTQMQNRTQQTLEEADFVIHVIDSTSTDSLAWFSREPDLIVLNKSDLCPSVRGDLPSHEPAAATTRVIRLSALHRENLATLESAMSELAFGSSDSGAKLALGARHVAALKECLVCLDHARLAMDQNVAELIAHDLRSALDALGSIVGHVTPDDLLGRIFGSFCIGK